MPFVKLKDLATYKRGEFTATRGEVIQVSEDLAADLEQTGYFDVRYADQDEPPRKARKAGGVVIKKVSDDTSKTTQDDDPAKTETVEI